MWTRPCASTATSSRSSPATIRAPSWCGRASGAPWSIGPGDTVGVVRARCLIDLGTALRQRFDLDGSATDRTAAVLAYRTAAGTTSAPVTTRLDAARRWARAAERAGDDTQALDAWTAAVELLPRAAWRGVDVVTRES